MKIEIDVAHLQPGDLVLLSSDRVLDPDQIAKIARFADHIRENRPGVMFVAVPPFVTVKAIRPGEIEWARWTWQMCRARHLDFGRCERPRGHLDAIHAVERGMDIPMWVEQTAVTT